MVLMAVEDAHNLDIHHLFDLDRKMRPAAWQGQGQWRSGPEAE